MLIVAGGCQSEVPAPLPSSRAEVGSSRTDTAIAVEGPEPTTPEPSHPVLPAYSERSHVGPGESAATLEGRVVSAAGEGVAGARVRLVGFPPLVGAPGQPHVWGAARSGTTGDFRLVVPAYRAVPGVGEVLVVESDEAGRTIDLPDAVGHVGVVRLGPVAPVRVELRCAELWPEEAFRYPTVVVLWPRAGPRTVGLAEEGAWSFRVLPPAGTAWPGPSLPGRDLARGGPIASGTEEFATELALPRGQVVRLIVRGACGVAEREVRVPAAGAMQPIVFALPTSGTGALELHLLGAAVDCPECRIPNLIDVWTDGDSRRVELTPSAPSTVRGLRPGRVRVGRPGSQRCSREVRVEADATTRVEVPVDGCLTFQLPPHW